MDCYIDVDIVFDCVIYVIVIFNYKEENDMFREIFEVLVFYFQVCNIYDVSWCVLYFSCWMIYFFINCC